MTILDDFISSCNDILVKNDGSREDVVAASEYLGFRGITEESIREYKIGFCHYDVEIPSQISGFGNDLSDFGNNEPRDSSYFLHGRIIVPVFDEFGNSVGLASRKPTFQKGETWWNLPAPFYKGRYLYLLNHSRKDVCKSDKIYLVEGYVDALYLRQAGIPNVACIMGTSLSPRKIALIARYCSNVCFCFDVDKNMAGQVATLKAICELHKLNFCESISVINDLPVGVDPDEFVKKNGVKEFLNREKVLSEKDIVKIHKDLLDIDAKRREDARKARAIRIVENESNKTI